MRQVPGAQVPGLNQGAAAHLSPPAGAAGRPGRAGGGGGAEPRALASGDRVCGGARRRLLLGLPAGWSVNERRGREGSAARLRPARWDNAALSGRKQPPRAASADAARA